MQREDELRSPHVTFKFVEQDSVNAQECFTIFKSDETREIH